MLKRNRKGKRKMTLVIGARCSDGVLIIADRKVVDEATNESDFEEKILFPLEGSPVIVAAAGYTHLFKEFNRRVPEMVEQRQMDVYMANVKKLEDFGEDIKDYYVPEQKPEKIQSGEEKPNMLAQNKKINNKGKKFPRLPYYYTIEQFLIDCKLLIRQICETSDLPDPLDVLVAVYSNTGSRLHHIDHTGNEEEINFCAIGSGQPYVNLFRKGWNSELGINESARLFTYNILAVDKLKLDNYVGIEEGKFPDMGVIIDDGRFGRFGFEDEQEKQILTKINSNLKRISELTLDY